MDTFTDGVVETLIEKLKDMGFNTYEAKVYLALLKHHPSTGYEISKESGVPQARAYDTLKALENSNAVISLGGKPLQYLPVSPNELLQRWENAFTGSMGFLKETLPTLSDETVEPIINLRGEDSIIKHAIELINRAQKNLLFEIWAQDIAKLREPLLKARDRGVAIKIVGFDDAGLQAMGLEGIDIYAHGVGGNLQEDVGGRWLIMCMDDKEGLVGTVANPTKAPQAVQTSNAGILFVIKEMIVHDIFLLDVEKRMPEEMATIYGRDIRALRSKILGEGVSTVHHFSFCG